MKKTLTLSLALAALATSGIASAQTEQRPERGAAITRQQATQMADRAFARMDANQDGKIDEADREAHQRARFDRLDADGNGSVTFAELQTMHAERREARTEARGEARTEEGRRGGRGMAGRRGAGAMVRKADADKDGTVTQAEFRAAALARFAAADADNDGTVTPEERRARRDEHRGQHEMPRRGPAG